MIESTHPLSRTKAYGKDLALICLLGILAAIVGLWTGGAMGFMHAIAEDLDIAAVVTMASLIAVIFVLLIRRGLLIGNSEEISQ